MPRRHTGGVKLAIVPCIVNLSTPFRRSASHPALLNPGKGVPSTHWLGDWVGTGVSLVIVQHGISFSPMRNQTPDWPAQLRTQKTIILWHLCISKMQLLVWKIRQISQICGNKVVSKTVGNEGDKVQQLFIILHA